MRTVGEAVSGGWAGQGCEWARAWLSAPGQPAVPLCTPLLLPHLASVLPLRAAASYQARTHAACPPASFSLLSCPAGCARGAARCERHRGRHSPGQCQVWLMRGVHVARAGMWSAAPFKLGRLPRQRTGMCVRSWLGPALSGKPAFSCAVALWPTMGRPPAPLPCRCSSSAGPDINVRDFLPVNQTVTARVLQVNAAAWEVELSTKSSDLQVGLLLCGCFCCRCADAWPTAAGLPRWRYRGSPKCLLLRSRAGSLAPHIAVLRCGSPVRATWLASRC